ncbi:CD99 antigen isoform X2 [Rhinoderma darwinii]|uniref:CD99 antigen isoform X2 n=1 Tax=Rhinoderma darwinii TaxID=43563 RepID=UPI003F670807
MKPKPGHGGGGGGVIPKKPTSKPQPDVGGEEDFDLGDALGGDDPHKPPTMKPKPGHGGGEFGDGDLGEVGHYDPSEDDNKKSGRAMQPSAGGGGAEQGQAEGNPSVLAGIVSAVAVAAVGAVSSFIAYQKKKLCFKGATDDPENVNMDSHKGDQFDPQAQNTLLSK